MTDNKALNQNQTAKSIRATEPYMSATAQVYITILTQLDVLYTCVTHNYSNYYSII